MFHNREFRVVLSKRLDADVRSTSAVTGRERGQVVSSFLFVSSFFCVSIARGCTDVRVNHFSLGRMSFSNMFFEPLPYLFSMTRVSAGTGARDYITWTIEIGMIWSILRKERLRRVFVHC